MVKLVKDIVELTANYVCITKKGVYMSNGDIEHRIITKSVKRLFVIPDKDKDKVKLIMHIT